MTKCAQLAAQFLTFQKRSNRQQAKLRTVPRERWQRKFGQCVIDLRRRVPRKERLRIGVFEKQQTDAHGSVMAVKRRSDPREQRPAGDGLHHQARAHRQEDVARLGGILPKTITQEPRPGNSPWRTIETAAGMLNAERAFRRIKGHKQMPQLVAALHRHAHPKTAAGTEAVGAAA